MKNWHGKLKILLANRKIGAWRNWREWREVDEESKHGTYIPEMHTVYPNKNFTGHFHIFVDKGE